MQPALRQAALSIALVAGVALATLPASGEEVAAEQSLTLEEASAYCGIGINKLREMSNDDNCSFVLWNGSKRLIKRKKLDEYLAKAYSI